MLLGLIGQDISRSRSPAIHEFSGRYLGINCSYQLFEIAGEALEESLQQFWQRGVHGLNVTKPHKRTAAKLLGLDPAISVNTLYRGPERWQACSTDGEGFVRGLERLGRPLAAYARIVILGAGGAVSALVETLGHAASELSELVILRRTGANDAALASLWPQWRPPIRFAEFSPSALQEHLPLGESSTLVVQASSAPAQGERLEAFLPALAGFTGSLVDLTYGEPSALWAYARERGLPCQDGLPMLIEQARLAQECWWARSAPFAAIADYLRVEEGTGAAPARSK